MTTPKITLVGSGYVGMSLSVLLAQHNDVTVLDIDPTRVETINNNQSTVADAEIEAFLAEHAGAVTTSHGQLGKQSGYMGVPAQKTLSLTATIDPHSAYKNADFIIVATPTNHPRNPGAVLN